MNSKKHKLPPWFSKRNYAGLCHARGGLGYEKWLDLLLERQLLFLNFKRFGLETLKSLNQDPETILGRNVSLPPPQFDDSQFRPVESESELEDGDSPDSPTQGIYANETEIGTIRSLTFEDINSFPLCIELVKDHPPVKKATDYFDEDNVIFSKKPYDQLMRDTNQYTELIAHAVVNMAAPDEQILLDFKKWLSAQRKVYGLAPIKELFFSKDRVEKWCKWRFLSYLDLYIWSVIEGITLSDTEMIEAVSNDFLTDAKINYRDIYRKSIRPEIDRILTIEAYETLCTLTAPPKTPRPKFMP
jgi:hypothetical protein